MCSRMARDRRAPDAWCEPSQATLGPGGANLLIAREFPALCGGFRPRERRALVLGECDRQLVVPCELQHDARDFVLRFRRQPASGLDGLFKQFGHDPELAFPWAERKVDSESLCEPGALIIEADVNYSLELWELEAGCRLACQSRPLTSKVRLDFDAV